MGKMTMDRNTGMAVLLSLLTFLVAILVMTAMGLEPYTVTWLAVITGSLIGMMASMVRLLQSMDVGDGEETSP
jgi:hypothetical protein